MALDELFEFKGSGNIVISKQAKTIPVYKRIITKDKGSEGDSDGRLKKRAIAEILYVYHMVHPGSVCKNLGYAEKKRQAIKEAGLPADWKEQDYITEAIVAYEAHIELSALGNSYYAAERSMFSVAEDIKFLQDTTDNLKYLIREKIKVINNLTVDSIEDTALVKELLTLTKELSKVQSEIADNITKLPKMKAVVDDLSLKFAEEGGGKIKPVGGGEIGNREL